ncbi:class II aldolase/adducin family protein [Anaerovibrio lipolyticus]|uniref:class II aldolase/adducin family protein n=1 Tax=Anaerovibrio lipolyticus TaxID=82374 RepID=UPI000ECEE000|nr:class II aldolase/adducin family protein [Anaerovibrio lipolyticus]MBE6105467.1 class II aldolase/adducin family protein [Anaerovibrio lipolyticus]HAF31968.1 class II aldolase family protein [Anaerovibrio sp.]HCP95179.1 class II aldolase family protein [Anaerovibrio sp.]
MLKEIKRKVLECAVKAENMGLCQHRSGNFSIRDEDTGLICITPTGMDRSEMTYHDIVVVNMNAEVVEAETLHRPTSEVTMHLKIYEARPDVNAVVHTHSKFALTFAILNKPIPAIVTELMHLGCKEGYIPVAPYGRPATPALAESVLKPLQISDVALMEKHGAVAVDKDIKEALTKAAYVEELAEIYYNTLTILGPGKEPDYVDKEDLQKWAYPKEIKLLPGENK